jgi:tRNA A-37 threonylcarbamoyl transferase component Bud32
LNVIGQLFGNYRALSLLGEGGMGAVYLAEHPAIGRQVAIKVLHRELIRDFQHVRRFVNEARAANTIRHPNIVEILDAGTTETGTPYLVMELLAGESLGDRLSRKRLELGEALDIVRQTASALHAAHRQGIVHRDLKPANLFLAQDARGGGREQVKVLDFGIAKLQTGRPADQVKTQSGMMLGTPTYMSPEQCLGTRHVGGRSDLYSLGVILYEMVCGAPPFSADAWGALVNMHVNQAPAPPRSLAPDLPEVVEAIILKALAKNPDDRFDTMADLQAAIEAVVVPSTAAVRPTAVLAGQTPAPPTTMSGSTGEQSAPAPQLGRKPPVRRWPLAAALAAALVAVLLFLRRGTLDPPPVTVRPAAPPFDLPASPPPAPAPPARTVQLGIETDPAGAQVIRASDGTRLGTTPFRASFAAGAGAIELRLEREGYEPVRRVVPLTRDRDEIITLSPKRPTRPRPKPRPPETQQPAEPAKL